MTHTFHLLAERDVRVAFPSIQHLVEHTCAQEKIKFKTVSIASVSVTACRRL